MTRFGVVVPLHEAPSARQQAAQQSAESVPLPVAAPAEVVVLDDRPVVVLGVRAALVGVPEAADVVVVGRTRSPLEAVRAAAARGLAVVVLLDDAGQAAAAGVALEAGALGAVLLDRGLGELVRVVRRAAGRQVAVAHALEGRLEEHRRLQRLFTPREREALALYATGLAAKSVARRMDVSEGTVKTYLKRLRQKARDDGLAADTKLDLAVLAHRLDLT